MTNETATANRVIEDGAERYAQIKALEWAAEKADAAWARLEAAEAAEMVAANAAASAKFKAQQRRITWLAVDRARRTAWAVAYGDN